MTLATIRTEAGLNQAELARLAHVSQPAISSLERGAYSPNVTAARRIATALAERLGREPRELFATLFYE